MLARRGHPVIIFEGGPRNPPLDFERHNAGPSTGRPHVGLVSGRMKAFGGTTRLWGGQLVPFDQGDFTACDQTGRPLWPISFEEIDRWVQEAYDLVGVAPAARETTTIFEKATGRGASLGPGLSAMLTIWLEQPDFTTLFAQELENSLLIDVVTDARLSSMRFSEDGRVAEITVESGTGATRLLRPCKLVLANGTIEIAGTLLRSQQLDPLCPFRNNPHVGRYYMDHLHGLVGDIENGNQDLLSNVFDSIYFQSRKYTVKLRTLANMRDMAEPNFAASINTALTLSGIVQDARDLVKRTFSGRASPIAAIRDGTRALLIVAPIAWRYLVKRRAQGLYNHGPRLGLEVEQLPHRESRLFLDPDHPPDRAPVGIHWHIGGSEVRAIKSFCENLAITFTEAGIGTLRIDPRILAEDPAFLDDFHDAYHQMGGARMALSDDHGVVDPDCRVFGTRDLYVAGAATFPSGSFANPTLNAIALGLRLADHLSHEKVPSGDGLFARLVFGTARLPGGVSSRTSAEMLEQVLNAGVRIIDTAPAYGLGTAENVVGSVLRRNRRGNAITVIAKVGLPRPKWGGVKSLLRAIKRRLGQSGSRDFGGWSPQAPAARIAIGRFDQEAMAASVAESRKRLGRFDYLVLHECGADEHSPAVEATLARIARENGAQPGYSWGACYDADLGARFPARYIAECAIPPSLLAGSSPAPERQTIFHSIVQTAGYVARTDTDFAARWTAAAQLIPEVDEATARIAAAYALAAAQAPGALLVFASTDPARLTRLLKAFHVIEERGLAPCIAKTFNDLRITPQQIAK